MAHKRRKKKHFHNQHVDNEFLDDERSLPCEIEQLFSKKFTLKERKQTWLLPQKELLLTQEPFVISKLLALKEELNATKSLLNDMDIEQWHQHTRKMHKGGLVVRQLREHTHAEMCTQAWAKFKEILGTYNLIPKQALGTKKLKSVHLCEAPGAFIACMNQHLKNNVPGLSWGWIGTTLNPYYEGNDLNAMLDDDSFILETRDHWKFCSDGTGDLMNLQNLISLKQDCETLGPVHLVTADGSINCADNPGEQEQVVSELIFCETLAAIEILSEGGNYVFKMFTALECHTVCMLYLLCGVFEEVHFIKPATSKAGNSEVYVVCLDYHGSIPTEYQEILHSVYNSNIPDKALIPLKIIPVDFIERLYECQHFFIERQSGEIVDNIRLFHSMSKKDKQFIHQIKGQVAEHYFSKFNVRPLLEGDRMVHSCYLDGIQRLPASDGNDYQLFSNRKKHGTYNEKDQYTWLDKIQQDGQFVPLVCTNLTEFCKSQNGTQLIPLSPEDVAWLEPTHDNTDLTLSLAKGKNITKVLNCRFCSSFYVTALNTALENASQSTQEMSQVLVVRLAGSRCSGQCNAPSIVVLDRLVGLTQGVNMTSQLLGLPLPCQCIHNYLQSQGIVNYETRPSHPADLILVARLEGAPSVFWDSSEPPLECVTKATLLDHCITALRMLKPGGTFICCMYSSLTRFTVGLLYLLHNVFEKIAIIKSVVGSLCSSERFLVCKGFIDGKENIMTALLKARDTLEACEDDEDLLEIVHMRCLYEERFCSFVRRLNEQLAHIQIANIVNRESFNRDVIEEQYDMLGQEIRRHFDLSM